MFVFVEVIDLYYSLLSKEVDANDIITVDTRIGVVSLGMKLLCTLVLFYFLNYEIKSARKQQGYFNDFWNLIDMMLIALYIPTAYMEHTNICFISVTILQAIIISLSFLKINFFLRIYDNFSFLVSMMAGVFADIKTFFAFWIIFLSWFTILFTILFKAAPLEQYEGLGLFGYFMMSYRLSSGDFEIENYSSQRASLIIFTWIVWIVGVLVLNVIFMNFIIAVISESYEKVMQKLVAQSFIVKAEMIVERELHMAEEDLRDPINFPKFLVLRKPASAAGEEGEEWQGFIKDIKHSLKLNFTRIN